MPRAWRDALEAARRGEIAVLSHPWGRAVPDGSRAARIVKVLCADEQRLLAWGRARGVDPRRLDHRGSLPHFDFWGDEARRVGLGGQLEAGGEGGAK